MVAMEGMTFAASDNAGAGQRPVEKEKTTFMTYTFPDGIQYVGEFRDGRINGQGTLTWPDGQKYVGEFSDNKMNGQGMITWPNGDNMSVSSAITKRNGPGKMTYAGGEEYDGEFRDDKMQWTRHLHPFPAVRNMSVSSGITKEWSRYDDLSER